MAAATGDRLIRLAELPSAATALILMLLVWIFLRYPGADPDLFARVAAGWLLFKQGAVPLQDPFAFTPKKPVWIDHEWLSGVVFYLLSGWGDPAFFLFKCLCAGLTLFILMSAARRYAGSPAAGFWPMLAGALACAYVWSSTVRAQVFTFLFLAIYLRVFVDYLRGGSARLWVLPAVMLLWVNLHGGFVAGLGLFMIFAAARGLQERRLNPALCAAVLACFAVTAVNPYGLFAYWAYIMAALRMPRPAIGEWAPLSLLRPAGLLVLLWTALLAAGVWRRRGAVDWSAAALTIATLAAACLHNRLTAIYLMVSLVFGRGCLEAGFRAAAAPLRLSGLRPVFTAAAVLAAAVALVLSAAHLGRGRFTLSYGDYPVNALAWLRESRTGGRLLVDFNAGSFALWRLYPAFLVSMDGRYEEVYPEETLALVNAALDPAAPEHQRALAQINPDFILLGRNMRAFGRPGKFGPAWHLIYHDGTYLILGREANPLGMTGMAPQWTAPMWRPWEAAAWQKHERNPRDSSRMDAAALHPLRPPA